MHIGCLLYIHITMFVHCIHRDAVKYKKYAIRPMFIMNRTSNGVTLVEMQYRCFEKPNALP